MSVIAENLVRRACIEIRQGRATPADLKDFRAARLRPDCCRRTRCRRSSAALRTAVVTDSPAAAASARASFLATGSLMLRGMGCLGRNHLHIKKSCRQLDDKASSLRHPIKRVLFHRAAAIGPGWRPTVPHRSGGRHGAHRIPRRRDRRGSSTGQRSAALLR